MYIRSRETAALDTAWRCGVTCYFRVNALPRWRPCGTFWRMAKRLRAHSTRLILDWPLLRAYIQLHQRAATSSALTAIINPFKGLSENRRTLAALFYLCLLRAPFPISSFFIVFSILLFAGAFVRGFGDSKQDAWIAWKCTSLFSKRAVDLLSCSLFTDLRLALVLVCLTCCLAPFLRAHDRAGGTAIFEYFWVTWLKVLFSRQFALVTIDTVRLKFFSRRKRGRYNTISRFNI